MFNFTPKFHTPPTSDDNRSPYDTPTQKEKPVSYSKESDLAISQFLRSRDPSVKAKREAVGRQYRVGINKLQSFIATHAAEKSTTVDRDLDTFIERLESGLGDGTGGHYSTQIATLLGDGKVAMDMILQTLERPDIPMDRKIDEVVELSRGLVVCGPGVGTNLIMHAQALQFAAAGVLNHARGRWEEMFNNAMASYCREKHGREPNYAGNETHYVAKYRSFLGPLYGLKPIRDEFNIPQVQEEDAIHCMERCLSDKMTPAALLDELADDCLREINRVFKDFREIQDREGSLTEEQVYELGKRYEKDLEDSFTKNYGGIPLSTIVNEYYNTDRDGETYCLIDNKVLLAREIARNLRTDEAIVREKIPLVASLPTTGENGAPRNVKTLGPTAFYVKEKGEAGVQKRYALGVNELMPLLERVRPRYVRGVLAGVRPNDVDDQMVLAALENTFDKTALAKLDDDHVWRAVSNTGRASFRDLIDSLNSPGVRRYREADPAKSARLVDRVIGHLERNAITDDRRPDDFARGVAVLKAIEHSDTEVATQILARVDNIRLSVVRSADGASMIHTAAEHGMTAIVDELINRKVLEEYRQGNVGQEHPRQAERQVRQALMSKQNRLGWTPLTCAARGGNIGILDKFLEMGAEINQADRNGRTALFHAASTGKAGAIRFLRDQGAAQMVPDKGGRYPIQIAAANGHADAVGALLDCARSLSRANQRHMLDAQDERGETVLMTAAYKAPLAVPSLISHGAQIETRNPRDRLRAIDYAVQNGKVDAVRALCEANANVEVGFADEGEQDWGPAPPLAIAAVHGHGDVAVTLLQFDAAIDGPDRYGRSAIARAAGKGHRGVVEKLATAGANVNLPDRFGTTPLQHAIRANQPQCVSELLYRSADINVIEPGSGRTPLFDAATMSPESVKLLLNAGANPNSPDRNGETPAMAAIKSTGADAVAVLNHLIEARVDLSKRSAYGYCAMDWAVEYGNVDVIKLIAGRGADVDAPDTRGIPPLGRAVRSGRPEVVKALLNAGADPTCFWGATSIEELADQSPVPEVGRLVRERKRELQDHVAYMDQQFQNMDFQNRGDRRYRG